MSELVSHAATVLSVSDMKQSLEFYTKVLGFELTFGWNEPVDYAVLKRGDVSIHLTSGVESGQISKNPVLYIFVYDVDLLFDEIVAKGGEVKNDPGDREYGMRDFDIEDPDGYMITFGKGI